MTDDPAVTIDVVVALALAAWIIIAAVFTLLWRLGRPHHHHPEA